MDGSESANRNRLVRFEWHLQNTIAKRETIERIDRHQRFVIVGHRDKTETFAFLRLKITNDLHVLHGAERSEQLPEDALFGFRCQIVDKYTPTDRG